MMINFDCSEYNKKENLNMEACRDALIQHAKMGV